MAISRWVIVVAAAGALPLAPCVQAQSPDAVKVAAEVEAADSARLRGDSAAWKLVAPGFVFVHSTGDADDLPAFLAWRARNANSPSARAPRARDAAPPILNIDGDVFTRVRLLADSAPPGVRPGQTRVVDVYVRRDGQWLWLAHTTSEVRPRWAEVNADASLLDDYAGTYRASNGTSRTFTRRGAALVQLTAAGGERAMVPLSDVTFGYDGLQATVTFARDRTGRVVTAEESARVGFTRFVRSP